MTTETTVTGRHGDRTIEHGNHDKVFFPDAGLTKGDLVDYYSRIAQIMLPHVRGRIAAMRRYPDGLDGPAFFQKQVPGFFPDWIRTVDVDKTGGSLEQITIEDPATLVYLAEMACIEIHVWTAREDRRRWPDRMIFDLDPSGEEDFARVKAGARALRTALGEVGMSAFVMTTGSRGLHVTVPLDRSADVDDVRAFARRLATVVADAAPDDFTTELRKDKRRGRVFIDVLRNAYGQHAIAPYSVRARVGAPVATPLDWDELDRGELEPRRYTIRNIFRRMARKEDPWREIDRRATRLPSL